MSVVKLTMRPGKTYYLVQNISPVPISAPTPGFGRPSGGLTRVDCRLDLLSPDEFMGLLQKGKGAIRYASYDKTKPVRSMDPGEKREYEAGYEYWAKSNPDQARKHDEYMGFYRPANPVSRSLLFDSYDHAPFRHRNGAWLFYTRPVHSCTLYFICRIFIIDNHVDCN
jgi:hypothetical protein